MVCMSNESETNWVYNWKGVCICEGLGEKKDTQKFQMTSNKCWHTTTIIVVIIVFHPTSSLTHPTNLPPQDTKAGMVMSPPTITDHDQSRPQMMTLTTHQHYKQPRPQSATTMMQPQHPTTTSWQDVMTTMDYNTMDVTPKQCDANTITCWNHSDATTTWWNHSDATTTIQPQR